jgi:hypothetical protein
MRKFLPTLLLLGAFAWSVQPNAYAQTHDNDIVPAPEARQSPLSLASTKINGETYVRVIYGSPRVRGREIFGGLVPYGEVWRTGANEATEITFSQDVTFGGQAVDAGTYAVFTIPGADEWTVILNRTLGQWGAYAYDADADLVRIQVPATSQASRHEAFTMRFDEADHGADLVMLWDRTRVAVPITAR